jgi:hypothetical protein
MNVKTKRCKICKKGFKPFKTTQVVCSPKCAVQYIENTKLKKEAQSNLLKIGLDNRIKEIKLSKDLENTKKQVHNYIHLRDKGNNCISCDRVNDGTFDAGHYFKAELYSSLKFNTNNIHLQCRHCNRYLEGHLNAYLIGLQKKIGKDNTDKLNELSEAYTQSAFKWNREDLKTIRNEVKELRKQLNGRI